MRRLLLLSILALMALPGAMFGQSTFRIVYPNGNTQTTFNTSVITFSHYLSIESLVSNRTIGIKARRVSQSIQSGDASYFCWGTTCYPPSVSLSPDTIEIQPNATRANVFTGYYGGAANGNTGVVTYRFFNFGAFPADSVDITFTYNYTTGTTSIAPALNVRNEVSQPSPNPAFNSTVISYSLTNPNAVARLKVYDLLGQEVRNYSLQNQAGQISLDVSQLQGGIYFYSMVVDGKTIATRRLVVAN
jgi:hypothetical protein